MTSNAFERSQKIGNVTYLGVELLANVMLLVNFFLNILCTRSKCYGTVEKCTV